MVLDSVEGPFCSLTDNRTPLLSWDVLSFPGNPRSFLFFVSFSCQSLSAFSWESLPHVPDPVDVAVSASALQGKA